MTKEEIKEMIDSTININGKQEITGYSLNLALNAIVDGVSDNNNYIYGPDNLTDSEQEHNIQMYNKITNNLISGNTGVQYFLRMPSGKRQELYDNEYCYINDQPINFLEVQETDIIFTAVGSHNYPQHVYEYSFANNGKVLGGQDT